MFKKILLTVITLYMVLVVPKVLAGSFQTSGVVINGRPISMQEKQLLEQQIGAQIAQGNYAVNMQNGCWYNYSNGTSGCIGSGTTTNHTRYGSGERNAQGDWSYYSNVTGNGGVGGTSDGCYYAFGWSNC